jgi:hypothetical protein
MRTTHIRHHMHLPCLSSANAQQAQMAQHLVDALCRCTITLQGAPDGDALTPELCCCVFCVLPQAAPDGDAHHRHLRRPTK